MSQPSLTQQQLADTLKLGMRQWASGVSIISARDEHGEPQAMTASSLTSISDAPASLLVCVNHSARMANVLQPGTPFCANLLGTQHENLSNICASPDTHEQRFQEGDWNTAGVPKLNDALAVFECVVDQVITYGTHQIVIGKLTGGQAIQAPETPLCYWNGSYRQLADQ